MMKNLLVPLFLLVVAVIPARAASTIVGVNVVGVDKLNDKMQDDLILHLQQAGVTTIRTGFINEKYAHFIVKAYKAGIGTVAILAADKGNSGQHTSPPYPALQRLWPTAALSDVDPGGFQRWYLPLFAVLEMAGVRLTAMELGNELNSPRFNADFPLAQTGRVLGVSDLELASDSETQQVAQGYAAYIRILRELKNLRDHSRYNQRTPILSGMSANWGPAGPTRQAGQPDSVSPSDSILYMRRLGLDNLVDGYSVHFYPSSNPNQPAGQRLAALQGSRIFAACQSAEKQCWLTEWAINNPVKSCPINDNGRAVAVSAERKALARFVNDGQIAAVLYYSWSGGPGEHENQGAIFRCGALTEAGQLAISPF